MSKESVLEDISECGKYAFSAIIVVFFMFGVIIITFLQLIVVAKLYSVELALELTRIIKIIYNSHFYILIIVFFVMLFAEVTLWMVKKDKKFRERKKEELKDFVDKIIEKSRRKK